MNVDTVVGPLHTGVDGSASPSNLIIKKIGLALSVDDCLFFSICLQMSKLTMSLICVSL